MPSGSVQGKLTQVSKRYVICVCIAKKQLVCLWEKDSEKNIDLVENKDDRVHKIAW